MGTPMKTVKIENVEVHLANPVDTRVEWIGQEEPLTQLLACWLEVGEKDQPLCPRLVGHPGLGKTTLGMAAARKRGQEVYILQCTADTRPEDLIITPVLGEKGSIKYQASPLVSAMLAGGVVILDEGNRMSEKSWASLAPLLDDRKAVDSLVAGINIKAHKDFRCVVTMNDDDSTFEIPDYIMSRIQPAIELPFPKADEELQILRYNLPSAPEELLRICVGYLQQAHDLDLPYSIRDGLNASRFAQKLGELRPDTWERLFRQAISQVLGEEALDMEALAQKRRREGLHLPNMQLGDFFFDDDNPLNPDKG
jgi:MoxR-like ATPase